MSEATPRHALVVGASGLAGWAVVNEILKEYPVKGTFAKVTAVVNRPLSVARAQWPTTSSVQIQLVSGVNLTAGSLKDTDTQLRDKIPDLETVTHLYYFGKHVIHIPWGFNII
jgi:nucleoside-diphosphate-sugar epimerase